MAQRVYKTLLKPAPDDARAQRKSWRSGTSLVSTRPGSGCARSLRNWSGAAWR